MPITVCLLGPLCCRSVWMNLSPMLTDADADAQRKRNRAGKTRLCDSDPHVMKNVCPPKLVWICRKLDLVSGVARLRVERFEWIYNCRIIVGVMAKTNGLLWHWNPLISDFVCSSVLKQMVCTFEWENTLTCFCNRTKWSDEPNKFRLNSRCFMGLAFAKLFKELYKLSGQ